MPPKVLLVERSKAALMLSLELMKMWIDRPPYYHPVSVHTRRRTNEQIKGRALTLYGGTHL